MKSSVIPECFITQAKALLTNLEATSPPNVLQRHYFLNYAYKCANNLVTPSCVSPLITCIKKSNCSFSISVISLDK